MISVVIVLSHWSHWSLYNERKGRKMYSHVAFRHQTILNLSDISLIFFIVVRTTWRVHGVENCGFLSVKDFSLKFLNGSGVCRKICLIFWYIIFKSWWIQHQKLTWNCNMHNFLNGLFFLYVCYNHFMSSSMNFWKVWTCALHKSCLNY